jgi:hypothetical protein
MCASLIDGYEWGIIEVNLMRKKNNTLMHEFYWLYWLSKTPFTTLPANMTIDSLITPQLNKYPLVMTNIAIENHHFSWENPLLMAIFNSYVSHYQRVTSKSWDWRRFLAAARKSKQKHPTPSKHDTINGMILVNILLIYG